MTKTQNLDEKIYIFCYSQPRYQREIIQKIYPDKPEASSSAIIISDKMKQLTKKGWIKPVLQMPKPDDVAEYRMQKRKYYLSISKPIVDDILQKTQLTSQEQKQLKTILEKKSMRKIFLLLKGIDSIQGIIGLLAILSLVSSTTCNNLKPSFPNLKKPRKDLIKEIRKNKKFVFDIQSKVIEEASQYSPQFTSTEPSITSETLKKEITQAMIDFFALDEILTQKISQLMPYRDLIHLLMSSTYAAAQVSTNR